jgi:hypothetical protein
MILFLLKIYLASSILTYLILRVDAVDEYFREEMQPVEWFFTIDFMKAVFILMPIVNSLFFITIVYGLVYVFVDDQRIRFRWMFRNIKRKIRK